MSDSNFLTKLTISGMGCNPSRAKSEKKTVPLAHIFGLAHAVKTKTGPNDEVYTGIQGQFEGVNLETGEVYQAAIMYLPSGLQEAIIAGLNSHEGKEPLQFAFEISAYPASNPIGYSYSARQLVEPQGADPLAALRDSVAEKVKALPAPEKAGKAA